MARNERYRLSVDVGGTFTDLVLHDEATGTISTGKVLTTPADPSAAILEGTRRILGRAGITTEQLARFIHATTRVTNTLIERTGAKTALLTTLGFRDSIEMGTETRYDIYDLGIDLPVPLVPRELRKEVTERIGADAMVVTPVDLAGVERIVADLVRQEVTAIAVCLLSSYANPAHEKKIGDLIKARFPGISVSLSCEIQPEIREFERVSTTVANAYVQPKVELYLQALEEALRTQAFGGRFHIMLSSGGLTECDVAMRFPIKILESGPAAGVEAARFLGAAIGINTLVSFDMGGTTAKIGLITDGAATLSSELEVARLHRFKKGSGLVVKAPTVELIEIGAGGGSIARVDQYGLLKVGPQSAGADPGPACYGRGGEQCTVTDADLVLGYLDAEDFAGKEMKLDRAASESCVGRLADRLGIPPLEVAWGIHDIANENMATAARIHLVERGKDPAAFTFMAFGGAGPLHAQGVAKKIGVRKVIVPNNAGVMSAVGLLAAPMSFDVVRTCVADLAGADWALVNRTLDAMANEARQYLKGVPDNKIRILRKADMRYRGQGSEILVRLPESMLEAPTLPQVRAAFYAAYDDLFGRHLEDVAVEFVNFRVRAISTEEPLVLQKITGEEGTGKPSGKPARMLKAYFREAGSYVDTAIYAHEDLAGGARFSGPAIVRSKEFSALIGPQQSCAVDERGNLVIDL